MDLKQPQHLRNLKQWYSLNIYVCHRQESSVIQSFMVSVLTEQTSLEKTRFGCLLIFLLNNNTWRGLLIVMDNIYNMKNVGTSLCDFFSIGK